TTTRRGESQRAATGGTQLAATYDGANLRLFVTGIEARSAPKPGNIAQDSSIQASVGNNSLDNRPFDGVLDELRIYNRALSAQEILALMSTPVMAPELDVEPPSTPTGVDGLAIGSTRIRVFWDESTDDFGVAEYRVTRDGVEIGSTTSTELEDFALEPGVTYEYRVIAVDPSGNESVPSSPVEITT